jgi:hypothetical protein
MEMSKKLTNQYQKAVHDALERCQFIEETLRMCISHAMEIAKLQLSPYYPLKYTHADLSKLSMGKMASIFSRISDDALLKKSLNSITTERNYVAHQSLLSTIGESNDPIHMKQQIVKIDGIKQRAVLVHNSLLDARYKLLRSLRVLKRQQNIKRP